MTGKTQNLSPMWKTLMTNYDLDEPTSFLDHAYFGMHSQRVRKPNEIIIEEYRETFEHRISAGATGKLPGLEKNSRKDGCVVLRHGRTCSKNALRDRASWQKKRDRAVIQSLKSLLG